MSLYFSPPYTYEPIRFRVPELHAEWPNGAYHVENPDGIEVIQAHDYDELRGHYDKVREALTTIDVLGEHHVANADVKRWLRDRDNNYVAVLALITQLEKDGARSERDLKRLKVLLSIMFAALIVAANLEIWGVV